MDIQLSDIWMTAGVVLGFQITWFTWRISRETKMRSAGEITWLPIVDMVNLISMILIAIGVFILPALGFRDLNTVMRVFGLAIFLVVGHSFAMAGHYELFNKKEKREQTYCPFQERIILFTIAVLTFIYIVLWVIIG